MIIGPRSTVQSERNLGSELDLRDPVDIQALLRFSLHHASQHAMHVPHSRGQDIDSGGLDELLRFLRGREVVCPAGSLGVDFGAGSDVPDLAFHQNVGIDRFERLDRGSGLPNILFEGESGKIKDHGVEPRLGGFERLPRNACGLH